MTVLYSTLPIFLIIAFGYMLTRLRFFTADVSSVLTRLIFYIVMPITLDIIKQSASFLALLALGLSIGDSKALFDTKEKTETLLLIGFKSVLHPYLAFMVGYFVLHLSAYWLLCLTLMAAMPAAKNLFVFSQRYGLAVTRANVIVLSTTVLSIITINLLTSCFSYLSQ